MRLTNTPSKTTQLYFKICKKTNILILRQLLPLPKSWPISPDDAQGADGISLRGTIEWAPPRPQIIFTAHMPPV